ncbi:DUF1801 domain-containing protein [Cardiobacteriaceae bacterium TAE3-ERU3]|nr:DUF1801 domain-containing protein [Cardiobacteriaceae bacterium TAE3-ERU3]
MESGSADVLSVIEAYPDKIRARLLEIRELVYQVANECEEIGPLTETLKWSQPSFLTEVSGSGTTVRIDRHTDNEVAIYFHCQTTLIETFREWLPELNYSKNRAIVLNVDEPLPVDEIRTCLEMALTYKLDKRAARRLR